MNTLHKHLRYLLRKNYWPHEKWIRKQYNQAIFKAFYFVNDDKIEGDYFEFGVYKGDSLKEALDCANRFNLKDMKFWAFDSFKGCPHENNETVPKHFEEGSFSCSLNQTKKLFTKNEINNKINFIEGFFSKTLNSELRTKIGNKKASIINIDCDLYSSTLQVLNFITPLLQTGTIIFFDDFFCHKGSMNKGEQRAFHEWHKKNSHSILLHPFFTYGVHGKVFICEVIPNLKS